MPGFYYSLNMILEMLFLIVESSVFYFLCIKAVI